MVGACKSPFARGDTALYFAPLAFPRQGSKTGHFRTFRAMIEDRRKPGPNRRLDSWKEIASYFGRDERTVKRWEKDRGLPVRRLPGAKGRVYAFTDDLARWMNGRDPSTEESFQESISLQDPTDSTHTVTATAEADAGDPLTEVVLAESATEVETKNRGNLTRWLPPVGIVVFALLVFGFIVKRHDDGLSRGDSSADVSRPANKHVPTPAAQEAYLQGRYYWNKRTSDDLKKALRYFEQAVAADPNYALAYVGLADCYNLLREYAAMPEDDAYRKAIEAAKKAVELDPALAEAHNTLAFDLFFGTLDKKDAEQEFQTALNLNPNCEIAHHWYASYLMALGRTNEALAQIEVARQLNSSSRSILADKGLILFYAGRRDEATVLLKQIEETEPNFVSPHRYLAMINLVTGNYEAYLGEARKAAVLSGNETDLLIVNAAAKGFQHGGSEGMLNAMLAQQEKAFSKGQVHAFRVAETLAMLGQKEQALAYLRTSYQNHEVELSGLAVDPLLGNVRSDPSYQELAVEVGMS